MSRLYQRQDLMPDGLPRPNIPLLVKILDHIDAHPETYDQRETVIETECGTAHCIAGHAVAMTEGLVRNEWGELMPASGLSNWDWSYCRSAQVHLGLTLDEANALFAYSNTREDVQRISERIADRAGERL